MALDRAAGIGGSDIAAILGLSPYRTPFDVWLEKTRDPSWVPQEDTPQMRFGRLMEPVLAQVYMEDHPGTYVDRRGGHNTDPIWTPGGIVYAHIDGTVRQIVAGAVEDGIWEGKTAWDDRDWQAGPPDYYEAQVRTYLAATMYGWCDVTVFFRQTARFDHYRIEADPETDAGLITLAERWWDEHVNQGNPPAIDGTEGAARFLAARFPRQTTDEVLIADASVDELGKALVAIRRNIEQAQSVELAAINGIKDRMSEYGRIEGTGWHATWRRSKGATKVAWQEVAAAYRGLLHQVKASIEADRAMEALSLLTDNDPETIMGLYTTQTAGSRPFVFKPEKGD